jgi:hypothetical protein
MFEEDGYAGEWGGNRRGYVSSDLEEILGVAAGGCFLDLAITSGGVKIPGGYRQNAAALWGCFLVVKWMLSPNILFSKTLYIKRG